MEGHALAQQADVEFLTSVALQPLPDNRTGEISAKLQNGPDDLANKNAKRGPANDAHIRRMGKRGVERDAYQNRHNGRQGRIPERADEHDKE